MVGPLTGREVLQDRPDRPVVRVGAVVRRPVQPQSVPVRDLLTHVRAAGFVEAPEPLAIGEHWESVRYIPGVSGDDAATLVRPDAAVAAIGRLLRRYHDAVRGWRLEGAPRWFDGSTGTGNDGLIVCHGDVGPWNIVWEDGRPVGLIDWQYAHVGSPRDDVAYALHYLVPFRDRSYWSTVLGMSRRPERRHRLAVFAAAYGIAVDDALIDDVLTSQRAGVERIRSLAAAGDPRYVSMVEEGELEREERAVAWAAERRHRFVPRARPHLSPVVAIPATK